MPVVPVNLVLVQPDLQWISTRSTPIRSFRCTNQFYIRQLYNNAQERERLSTAQAIPVKKIANATVLGGHNETVGNSATI